MSQRDPMRWIWRGITGATLVLGWLFILWQNRFHVDPPVVIVCLGFLAIVFAVANLWRVGAAAVVPDYAGDGAWSRPLGPRAELDKEKKTLLRAIKEAEFDQAMGKLSPSDAEELIRMYRARAIELIKELDRLDAGHAETAREQIEREVSARLAVESEKGKNKGKGKGKKGNAKVETKAETKAEAKVETKAEAEDEIGNDHTADEPPPQASGSDEAESRGATS